MLASKHHTNCTTTVQHTNNNNNNNSNKTNKQTNKTGQSIATLSFLLLWGMLGRKSRVSVGRRGSAAVTSHWQQLACCSFPEWPLRHVTGQFEPRRRVIIIFSARRSHAAHSRAAERHMAHAFQTRREVISLEGVGSVQLAAAEAALSVRPANASLWQRDARPLKGAVRVKFHTRAVLYLTREKGGLNSRSHLIRWKAKKQKQT